MGGVVSIPAQDHGAAFFGGYFPENRVGIVATTLKTQQVQLQGNAAAFCRPAEAAHFCAVDFCTANEVHQVRVGKIGEGGQKARTSSYKLKKPWACNV